MCGVFGYIGIDRKGPNMECLAKIAKVTNRRGPHAWGMAWLDSKGRLKMYKQTGRIVDSLGLLAMARDAQILIGHCRYATHGSPENNLNNHPHPVDGGWFVHNGVVSNHEVLNERYGLHPVTHCDSETLGLLIERSEEKSLIKRCIVTAQQVSSPLVMLALWRDRMIALRSGNPLSAGMTEDAVYLGSLSDELPGEVHTIKDGQSFEFWPDGEIKRKAFIPACRGENHASVF